MAEKERPSPDRSSMDGEDPTFAAPRDGSEVEPVIPTGVLLCGRFRIVRFIARGGMGQVYEAEDLELRQRVALKTIRPALSRNPQAMERFRREIQLSRRITHPNVCRIHDVFRHGDSDSPSATTFLTMELLEGETLSERLEARSRMDPDEARDVVRQMVAGLEAAHSVGVVHRDLKPQNVMLVDSGEAPRVVVTDFGLAREQSSESASRVTETGSVLGTLAYMAPEQLEGKEASTSSDIYALGLIMYEMLTGVRPFPAESPVAAAANRLSGRPSSPKLHMPNLGREWEATILRCLERKPERRFATPTQVAEALERVRFSASPTRRAWLLASSFVVVALLVVLSFALFRNRPVSDSPTSRETAAASSSRRSVALLGFKNLTARPEASWLSTALSEMLSTELALGQQLRVVPGELVARAKVNLALTDADSYAPDTLDRIRGQLNTDFVVLGSYVSVAGAETQQIRLDVRIQDTRAGETIAHVSETGSEQELFELVADAGAGLRNRMGVEMRFRGEAGRVNDRTEDSLAAERFYATGLEQWRTYDYSGARASLERAVEAGPDHALAHLALAGLLSELGHRDEALREAERASALSDSSSREDRLLIQARYLSLRDDFEEAVDTRRSLVSLFPDELHYQLELARTLARGGRTDEAFVVLDDLGWAAANPRVALTESFVAREASAHARQLDAARRAARRAKTTEDRLTLAEARVLQASVSPSVLDSAPALQGLAEARQIYRDVGDALGEARVLRLASTIERAEDPESADRDLERANELLDSVGAAFAE